MSEQTLTTSSAVLDAFIERSWRSNAERQRAKGAEFVIGKREGIYMWDLEGDHRVMDCGTAGGVHSLGHRHPEILAALRGALDDGRDTGLWSVPNLEYLKVQDRLTRLSPSPELNRSLFTLCSTLSVDAATMFSMRYTGRQKMVAYRHGYHGHTGFAAQLTGSLEEGIIDHYNLPDSLTKFFDNYGDLDELDRLLTDDVAALIMEPMNYESFAPATQEFMDAVTKMCNARGVLFIIDETRTGLGRTGKLWASEHFNLRPDMLVTGKGLSGGLYPASALLMKQAIYEKCMNEHKFSYISSLGGNEISCIVADKVLEVSSRPEVLQHVNEVSSYFRGQLQAICDERQDLYTDATSFGCILSMGIRDPDLARQIYSNLYFNGILCHSICELEVSSMKFLPPLVITREDVDEIIEALKLSIQQAL